MNSVIPKYVSNIMSIMSDAKALLHDVRERCPHESVEGEYKASTGNWCEQDDSYWIVATCNVCGQGFYADSVRDRELYRKLSMSGSIK